MPPGLEGLTGKTVGIVGLGSVGSKVAISLARAGVSHFFLVDEDVFLPENVCRHVLDWRNVGEHKVDAVKAMLSYIGPGIEVEISHLNLTGQESTESLSIVLNRLGQSDVLIDATANPQVFNLMSGVVRTYGRPLVWVEVYAGGIGGLVARSRPGHDPDPHTMRAAYHHFTSTTPKVDLIPGQDYTAEDPQGTVVSASDADVGVLAYHAVRLAIDTLLKREPPMFPYSMYLIGLSQSWLFEQPFHTVPIATDHLVQEPNPNPLLDGRLADSAAFIAQLLEKGTIENSSS